MGLVQKNGANSISRIKKKHEKKIFQDTKNR